MPVPSLHEILLYSMPSLQLPDAGKTWEETQKRISSAYEAVSCCGHPDANEPEKSKDK